MLSKQTKTIYCKSCFSVFGIHCIFRYEYYRAIELRWQQGCCQWVGSLQVSLYIGSASIVTCSKATGKWILLWLGRKTPPTGGSNSDAMTLAVLSHSLLTYHPPPNHDVCVLPPGSNPQCFPGLRTSKGVVVDLLSTNRYSLTTLTD